MEKCKTVPKTTKPGRRPATEIDVQNSNLFSDN